MRNVDWYFDFVSPFSYLCFHRLAEFEQPVVFKPVLFAGLLQHWGQKGPAEITAKRRWTYRFCQWRAQELGVPFRFPAEHPFNPLQYLRLALACGSRPDAVKRIFSHLWTTGGNASDAPAFEALRTELGVSVEELAATRDLLRQDTEQAAARGLFGVPTFIVDEEVFWGEDAVNFVKAYVHERSILDNSEMRRLDALPIGAARKA